MKPKYSGINGFGLSKTINCSKGDNLKKYKQIFIMYKNVEFRT